MTTCFESVAIDELENENQSFKTQIHALKSQFGDIPQDILTALPRQKNKYLRIRAILEIDKTKKLKN